MISIYESVGLLINGTSEAPIYNKTDSHCTIFVLVCKMFFLLGLFEKSYSPLSELPPVKAHFGIDSHHHEFTQRRLPPYFWALSKNTVRLCNCRYVIAQALAMRRQLPGLFWHILPAIHASFSHN